VCKRLTVDHNDNLSYLKPRVVRGPIAMMFAAAATATILRPARSYSAPSLNYRRMAHEGFFSVVVI